MGGRRFQADRVLGGLGQEVRRAGEQLVVADGQRVWAEGPGQSCGGGNCQQSFLGEVLPRNLYFTPRPRGSPGSRLAGRMAWTQLLFGKSPGAAAGRPRDKDVPGLEAGVAQQCEVR